MPDPLISVVMPTLNEEASVAAAVASVLAQRDVDVEVLVVDGASTDRTCDIVRELGATQPRVRLLHNPQRTIPAALNVGLAAARGAFLARVDAHATVSPDYLARAVARMATDPGLVAVGGIRRGVATTPTGAAVALALSSRFGVGDSINHYATTYQETDHASFGVYRIDAARAVGGWDPALPVNEDVDFDYRLLRRGGRIGFDPAMEIWWQVRPTIGSFFAQYRRYGRGKAGMARKNGPSAVRMRHLAAPTAVVGTAAVAALTLKTRWGPALLTPYAVGVAAASAAAWRHRPLDGMPPRAAALPAAFAAMHYGWGLGFLEGLVLRRDPALASATRATLPAEGAEAAAAAPAAPAGEATS